MIVREQYSKLFILSVMGTLQVPAGSRPPRSPDSSPSFISTSTHSRLLAEMMQSHLVKDMCLIGAKVHKQLPEPQQTGLHTSTERINYRVDMCNYKNNKENRSLAAY